MLSAGDLIKWYHYYDDMIIKNAGLGLVIEKVKDLELPNCMHYLILNQDGELEFLEGWQLEAVHLEPDK